MDGETSGVRRAELLRLRLELREVVFLRPRHAQTSTITGKTRGRRRVCSKR